MGNSIRLTEADITRQICNYLELRGWRKDRRNVGMATGASGSPVAFGERGMPDFSFYYYMRDKEGKRTPLACVLWVEFKRPGIVDYCRCRARVKTLCLTCSQKRWKERETARGAFVWRVDDLEDFNRRYDRTFAFLGGQKRMQFEEQGS